MSQVKTHATEVQKKTEPARQLEPEATRQPEQGPMQQVAPQAAYRRALVDPSGLRPADLLALQRTVGNRRVQRMVARRNDSADEQQQGALIKETPEIKVQTGTTNLKTQQRLQRRGLTTAEKVENLTAPRFAGDLQLEMAFDNAPPLRERAKGSGVAKVQQALIDDGFVMPLTVKKTGSPSGFFNHETTQTVRWFQQKYDLHVDGVVGRNMLQELDRLFSGKKLEPKEKPDISATEQAIGEQVVKDINRVNRPKTPNSGVFYDYQYKKMYKKLWNPDYENGFANLQYFDRLHKWDWLLKPGVSASEGIKVWLRGLTIAECYSAMIAVKYDALRAAVGDKKFDEKFGGVSNHLLDAQRLRISANPRTPMPLKEYMDWTEAAKSFGGATTEAAKAKAIGKPNQRPVKKGEWYYFSNHPKYPLKHPRESWQGENAVYMGKNRAGRQLWSGMGAAYRTEDVMYGTMVNYYNRERTERDYEYIVKYCTKPGQSITEEDIKKVHGNFRKVYMRYKNRILDQYKEGAFPDQITIYKLLNNPEYVLAGNRRKGGFRVDVGLRLNVAKVTEARNE